MFLMPLFIGLLISVFTLFSMDEVARHVVTFQLFDEKLVKHQQSSSLFILFHIDENRNLISTETGIKYILSSNHLDVICDDWKIVSMSRWLQNDYLMQTELQQENDNYIRLGINYDKINHIFPFIFSYGWASGCSRTAVEVASTLRKTSNVGCVKFAENNQILNKCISSGIVRSYSMVDDCSRYNVAKALLTEQAITLQSEEPYSNEGVTYAGAIELSETFVKSILNWILLDENRKICIATVELNNNVKIRLLTGVDSSLLDKATKEKEQVSIKAETIKKRQLWLKTLKDGLIGCSFIAVMYYFYIKFVHI